MTNAEILTTITVLGGAGLGTKMLTVLMETRDYIRDHMRDVGTKDPPTGLFKQVSELETALGTHEDVFAQLGFDRRNHEYYRRVVDRDRAGQ